MEKQNIENVRQVLDPIRIAIEYWQTDEKSRDEVLDRLNPEIREIVAISLINDKYQSSFIIRILI